MSKFIGEFEAEHLKGASEIERKEMTVLLCRILTSDDNSEYIKTLSEKYFGGADISEKTDALCGEFGSVIKFASEEHKTKKDTKKAEDSANFIEAVTKLPLIYDVYRYFSEYLPGDADGTVRAEVNGKLTEPNKKTEYPPRGSALSPEEMRNTENYIKEKIRSLSAEICGGIADAKPLKKAEPCRYCDFSALCENGIPSGKAYKYPYPAEIEKIKSEAIRAGV